MNQKTFNKMLTILNSCKTEEQYLNAIRWINELRGLYNFSSKQKRAINEECIRLANDLNV